MTTEPCPDIETRSLKREIRAKMVDKKKGGGVADRETLLELSSEQLIPIVRSRGSIERESSGRSWKFYL